MRRIIPAILVLTTCSCASAPPPLPSHVDVQRRTGEAPRVGEVSERSVGDVVYEIYNYEVRRDSSTRLTGYVIIDVFLAKANFGPETPLVATTDKGVSVHCTTEPVLRISGGRSRSHVCLQDLDSDSTFDQWRAPDGPPARRRWAPLEPKVGYEQRPSTEMAETGDGFRYELLYQGYSAGVVSILYREYFDSLVRPAFQQDLSYTLEPTGPTQISFRSIRMTIDSADNNRIRYTIDRGLER